MDNLIQALFSLSENNYERNKVDPKQQLGVLYREIRDMLRAITAMENKLEQLTEINQGQQEEWEQLLRDKPKWAADIEDAKERIIRQRGLTLKDMLRIQQEVVKLEDKIHNADVRASELQGDKDQFEQDRVHIVTRIKKLKAQYNQHAEIYNQEKAKADLVMGGFASREGELLRELSPEEQASYREALRSNPENPVVLLDGDVCSGCRIGLSKQLVKYVNQGDRLIICENCMRILLPAQI